jgi:hypothetical protein
MVDNAKLILLSTPNGQTGFYFDKLNSNNGDKDILKICDDIKNRKIAPVQNWIDDNGWNKFVIHWLANPKFQDRTNYLEDVQKSTGLSESVIQQEYNLSFLDSEELVFNAAIVKLNATLESFEDPIENSIYYIGVDTANMGNDYTVATVLKYDCDKYYLVNQYRKRRTSSEYDIYQIGELIEAYKPEKIGIEVTGGTGQVYLEQLSRQYSAYEFQAIKTTQESKHSMIERLLLALDKNKLLYPRKNPVIEEMLSYRKIGKKLEAQTGKHDDCVMSLAFSIHITPFKATDKSTLNLSNVKTF